MRFLRGDTRRILLVPAVLAVGAFLAIGCDSNDPFDPDSAPNAKPVVQLFAAPVDTTRDLSPTSYNERTFYWSGTDRDGWIVEYYVAICDSQMADVDLVATQSTDTTKTFETDFNGEAEAIVYLACRDNRGALSDTLVQRVPLKNFPPVVNFEADFDPRFDMQREITAEGDTLYWNWGVNNFRFFAFDPDGSNTMDNFYRYTLSDAEPTETFDEGDPAGDPELHWIRVPFVNELEEIHHFEIFFPAVAAGDPRKLTVSLTDEAEADTRFVYEWTVREPKGQPGSRVLMVQEGAGIPLLFQAALNESYGEDGWDTYRFWAQFPDKPRTLIETFRKFDLVIWGNTGGASPHLEDATAKSTKILERYWNGLSTDGEPEAEPGKLFMFSPTITGYSSTIDPAFRLNVLGVNSLSGETITLEIAADKQALGLAPHLLPMTSRYLYGGLRGVSLEALDGAEPFYQMEYCVGCYGSDRNAPVDPLVGVRRPERAENAIANLVVFGFTPEYFAPAVTTIEELDGNPTVAALRVILEEELGVAAP